MMKSKARLWVKCFSFLFFFGWVRMLPMKSCFVYIGGVAFSRHILGWLSSISSRWRCGAGGMSIDGRHEHTFIWLIYLFPHYSWRGPCPCRHHHLNPIPNKRRSKKKKKNTESKAERSRKYFGFCGFSWLALFPNWIDCGWCWLDVFLTLLTHMK